MINLLMKIAPIRNAVLRYYARNQYDFKLFLINFKADSYTKEVEESCEILRLSEKRCKRFKAEIEEKRTKEINDLNRLYGKD